MILRLMLVLLGVFHVVTGAWMLADPMGWYMAVPGVTVTGPANMHFIGDIGFAFLASGAGLILGARASVAAGAFALAGATWPTLHALMHIAGWFHHGFPSDPKIAVSEVVGVVTISFLGMALAYVRARKDGVV